MVFSKEAKTSPCVLPFTDSSADQELPSVFVLFPITGDTWFPSGVPCTPNHSLIPALPVCSHRLTSRAASTSPSCKSFSSRDINVVVFFPRSLALLFQSGNQDTEFC